MMKIGSKVTRNDVAELAGVSVATVSYVLNKSKPVSPTLTKRVLEAVEELGYVPDMVARSMVMSETKQLSVIVEDIGNQYFGELVTYFENYAARQGYFVSLCMRSGHLDDYISNFISRRVDGVLMLAVPTDFHLDKLYDLCDHGIKVVTSGSVQADPRKVSKIEIDYLDAMKKAIDFFHEMGHEQIAYLSAFDYGVKHDSRLNDFCTVFRSNSHHEPLVFCGKPPYNSGYEEGYRLAVESLESGQPFTAVLTTNDMMAIGAIAAYIEHGRRVPEDISVMGIDNIQLGKYAQIPLTTLSYDKKFFARRAFEMLYDSIKFDTLSTQFVRMEVVNRKSVCDKRGVK